MRVTICAYDGPNNIDGPTTWMKRLLPFLKENGVETRLLVIANQRKKLLNLQYFLNMGFPCKLIPAELFFEEQIKLILEDIEANPPHIYIPNYFPVAAYANYWVKKAGIPSVIVLHNDNDYHHCLVDEFVTGNQDVRVSAVVPVSKLLASKVEAKQPQNVTVRYIPYGAPVADTTAYFDGSDKLKLVYLGRLNNHQKRIGEVTRAFCQATKEIQNTEAVIYGTGDALQEVLTIIKQEGKESAVSYGGALPVSEVQKHLLQNHVYVLLSDYEGIPIALMEAMGCGLVPICSNIQSGIPELLEHGKNGLIVNDRNHEFIAAVNYLKNNPSKWLELSSAARSKIKENYSDKVINKNWLSLLNELACKGRSTGTLTVPSINELKKLTVKKEFLKTETRMPNAFMLPMVRYRKTLGRLKRDYLI